MAVSENTGGTQTATIGTEHALVNITTAGVFQLVVDTRNMADGDKLELRAYIAPRSGESRRLAKIQRYAHKQGDGATNNNADGEVISFSVPLSSPFSIRFTLKQTAGTGRSYVWSVWEL